MIVAPHTELISKQALWSRRNAEKLLRYVRVMNTYRYGASGVTIRMSAARLQRVSAQKSVLARSAAIFEPIGNVTICLLSSHLIWLFFRGQVSSLLLSKYQLVRREVSQKHPVALELAPKRSAYNCNTFFAEGLCLP